MQVAAVLMTVGILMWNAGVVVAATTEKECEALGGAWTCHCQMPLPPSAPPLSWGGICVFGVLYGLVAALFCWLGWLLRFA
jgi:hypothetical protein